MNYEDLVRDFAKRTRHNLEAIRQQQQQDADNEVFEVTQLINSMLGLLVLPQQRYYGQIPETPLADLRKAGWPEPVLDSAFEPPENLRDLIRLLRNSIAHFNIEFTENGGVIDGLHVWNNRNGKKTWQVKMSLHDLEQITERFIALIVAEEAT